ncbi:MAG: DUF2721 domain-containing protein [Gammaproteobacteria bacterium]
MASSMLYTLDHSNMDALNNIPTVAHVIQLAVAPVFLLTGIGAILGVLTNRLGRVVDRFRFLNTLEGTDRDLHRNEMCTLSKRARWNHWAITSCTVSALCICLSIAVLFVGVELRVDPSGAVSLLFVAAMLALIGGLLCFLREIALATGIIEIGKI